MIDETTPKLAENLWTTTTVPGVDPKPLAPRIVVRRAGDGWPELTDVDDLQIPLRSAFRDAFEAIDDARGCLARWTLQGGPAEKVVHARTRLADGMEKLWDIIGWMEQRTQEANVEQKK